MSPLPLFGGGLPARRHHRRRPRGQRQHQPVGHRRRCSAACDRGRHAARAAVGDRARGAARARGA